MHELSLAESVLEIALRFTPADARLLSVTLRAGPRRAVDPEAMQNAWTAILQTNRHQPVLLELRLEPWTIRCRECTQTSESAEWFTNCPQCHSGDVYPVGGNELQVLSVEVDESAARVAKADVVMSGAPLVTTDAHLEAPVP